MEGRRKESLLARSRLWRLLRTGMRKERVTCVRGRKRTDIRQFYFRVLNEQQATEIFQGCRYTVRTSIGTGRTLSCRIPYRCTLLLFSRLLHPLFSDKISSSSIQRGGRKRMREEEMRGGREERERERTGIDEGHLEREEANTKIQLSTSL